VLVSHVADRIPNSAIVPEFAARAAGRPPRFGRWFAGQTIQATAAVALEVAQQDRRVGVAWNADNNMHVIGHDSQGKKRPPPKTGGLPDLIRERFGEGGREVNGRTLHLCAGRQREAALLGVVERFRRVVFHFRAVAVADVGNETSVVARQPAAVGSPGEQPDAVHRCPPPSSLAGEPGA